MHSTVEYISVCTLQHAAAGDDAAAAAAALNWTHILQSTDDLLRLSQLLVAIVIVVPHTLHLHEYSILSYYTLCAVLIIHVLMYYTNITATACMP
jgi:hypothetical protein